jgi:hypothetical protein
MNEIFGITDMLCPLCKDEPATLATNSGDRVFFIGKKCAKQWLAIPGIKDGGTTPADKIYKHLLENGLI